MKYLFSSIILLGFLSLNGQVELNLETTVLTEREVAVDLDVPWEMKWGSDDFIWLTERKGRLLRVNPETGNVTVILDIQSKVLNGIEDGLLGFTFHPDFEAIPIIYMAYTKDLDSGLNIVSYEWNGSELVNEVTLLTTKTVANFHNGSRLLITPDEKLLVTVGDAIISNGEIAQDLNSLAGKILRMNLDGSVPEDNPFPNSYIYSFGHRNPQGLTLRKDGGLYSSEHGATSDDEINLIIVGKNYGWPSVEGVCNTSEEMEFCENNEVVEPIHTWTPCIAVNDILFYEHEAIPEWQGKLLVAALGGSQIPRISIMDVNADGSSALEENVYFTEYGRLRDVCVNPHNGAIYFATNGPGYPSFGPNRIIEYRNLAYNPTSVQSLTNQNQFIDVYPSPLSQDQQLHISLSESFQGSFLNIYSYSGELVKRMLINSKELIIDGSSFSSGSYFVTANNSSGRISKSFIIH